MGHGSVPRGRSRRRGRRSLGVLAALAMAASILPANAAAAQQPAIDPDDPRVGLEPGYRSGEAGEASSGMNLLANVPKPPGFSDGDSAPVGTSGIAQANSDLAFSGDYAIMGSYVGFTVYDISDPAEPALAAGVVCPGGQGDVTAFGDLLFVSVQDRTSRLDCTLGVVDDEDDGTFMGVRIFDLGDFYESGDAEDIGAPVANVQACRGSHTHTLVEDPSDADTVYIYVQGTNGRQRTDVNAPDGGCVTGPVNPENNNPSNDPADFLDEDGNPVATDRFQVEVIEVPLDAPATAEIVNEARLFEDFETSNPHGLWSGGSHGQGFQSTSATDACHDITAYPEIGLAAGACEGNGILIDISDPADPVRIDEVIDRNFAYWHSATFSNDGSKIIFTDEWGGGTGARCLATDRPEWGANAIFEVVDGDDGPEMQFVEYYKLPAPQTSSENCVAHNGSLVPVPGRDVMVQAWYQGGVSVWDFTDPASPYEIAYFDRGPTTTEGSSPNLGGFWSAYWYDGYVYGSEIVRGFDTFELTATDWLSQAELDAANSVSYGGQLNPQAQVRYDEPELPEPPGGPGEPVATCAAVEPVTFSDVVDGPHAANIECAAGFGVALGSTDGTFRPGNDVRRDQMASFIARLLTVAGADLPSNPPQAFGDVVDGPHQVAIDQLAAVDVVQGRRGGEVYDPAASVTRAQMASFLVRSIELVVGEELDAPRSPFTDIGDVHAPNIDIAYDLGIALGRTATTFEPQSNVLRGQMASFLARTLGHLDEAGVVLTPIEN